MQMDASAGHPAGWGGAGGDAGAIPRCPRCGLRLKQRITFWECPGCGYKEDIAREAPAVEEEPAQEGIFTRFKGLAGGSQPQASDRLQQFSTFEMPRELNTERTALKIVIIVHLAYLFILFKALSWFPNTPEGLAIQRYVGWIITLPSLLHLVNLHLAVRLFKQIGVVWGIVSAALAGVLLINAQGFLLPFFVYVEQYCRGSECPLWIVYGIVLFQLGLGVWTARFYSSEARLLGGA